MNPGVPRRASPLSPHEPRKPYPNIAQITAQHIGAWRLLDAWSCPLFGLHARSDGGNYVRRSRECFITVLDAIAAGGPREVRVDRPDVPLLVLMNKKSHRPIEPGRRARREEQRS